MDHERGLRQWGCDQYTQPQNAQWIRTFECCITFALTHLCCAPVLGCQCTGFGTCPFAACCAMRAEVSNQRWHRHRQGEAPHVGTHPGRSGTLFSNVLVCTSFNRWLRYLFPLRIFRWRCLSTTERAPSSRAGRMMRPAVESSPAWYRVSHIRGGFDLYC